MRTVGVEEEFLLVDEHSGAPASRAESVLARAGTHPWSADHGGYHAELYLTQVEAATGVCARLGDLRAQLTLARSDLARAAAAEGLRMLSTGTPALPYGEPPELAAGERFARIARIHAGQMAGYQACGCHVHVAVPDRDSAVAVVNHLRPWLPTLLALSANSPFHAGRDTGYASWRIMEQAGFPTAGVPPAFADAADHDRRVDRLVDCGVLADPAMTFWLARPSPTYPTVEVRAADAAAAVDDAVLQAALTRALVATALDDLAAGREAPEADAQDCAAALWNAARHGLCGPGVDPRSGRRRPAVLLLDELVAHVRPALESAGDLAEVTALLERVRRCGTGDVRQRRAARNGPRALIDALAEQGDQA